MKNIARVVLLSFSIGAQATHAYAQAFVPEEYSLSLSLEYNFVPVSTLLFSDGKQSPSSLTSHSFTLGAEFVPIDRLAIEASLPLLGVKMGDVPSGAAEQGQQHGRFDDQKMHLTITDLRAMARYLLLDENDMFVNLALGVGGVVPMTDYPRHGTANAGKRLKELQLNLAVSRTMSPVLPALYLHVIYQFALVERLSTEFEETSKVNLNHSNISGQIGYFILPELEVHLALDMQLAHGGFDFVDWTAMGTSQAIRDYHDPLLNQNYMLFGGGASYDITETLSVNGLVRVFLSGTNTFKSNVFGFGLTWQVL